MQALCDEDSVRYCKAVRHYAVTIVDAVCAQADGHGRRHADNRNVVKMQIEMRLADG